MSRDEDDIIAQAAAWHAASDSDDMDWDGFTGWLEADDAHRRAYDEVALADALVGEHRDALVAAIEPVAANDEDVVVRPRFASWQRWAGAAIAATLVAVLAVPQFMQANPELYETGGTARTIALDDGSSVILAPHSSLRIEGKRQERMALSGGAWFDIRHDPSRPLAITAGEVTISDIGTQFDVQQGEGHVRVEVAEGKVQMAASALSRPIALSAGKGVYYDGVRGSAVVAPVATDDAGEWRSGRLTYSAAPLPLVTADLSRYAGVSVTLPADLRDRRFSGTLVIGNGDTAI
ncbi:MAG: FecR domain-containing protein, partial [Novosphingobium sp.]|nr:FecR domain-containing protein [Novosphingobium sp.]